MQEKRTEIRWRVEELHSCGAPALSAVSCPMYLSVNSIRVYWWKWPTMPELKMSLQLCFSPVIGVHMKEPFSFLQLSTQSSEESLKWDEQLKEMHGKIYCGGITLLNKIQFSCAPHGVLLLPSIVSACVYSVVPRDFSRRPNKRLWNWLVRF